MKLKFCGAAGTVTGSCHMLTLDDGFTILLDCGLYQGNEKEYEHFNEQFLFDPKQIDVLVLSHAHIDHCGRIPKLVKEGFKGKIFSTPATQSLTSILLLDSAHIQEKESEFTNKHHNEYDHPLYTPQDVSDSMKLFTNAKYDEWFSVHPDVDVMYKDSGHILGAASVNMRIRRAGLKELYFGFTADIGRPDRPILRDPDPMLPCDILISESTYGDRLHETQPEEKEKLLSIIKEACINRRGKLISPAFSVGRTQEIVYMMDKLANENLLPDIPIYIDSPLSINATQVYLSHPECYDKEILDYMVRDKNPFGFTNLKYVRTVDESKSINDKHGCVVIAASGMINAGRVKHHVFNSIEHPENTILLVGYCSENTPGGQLSRGAKTIRLFGKELSVNASVQKMDSFSAHGDYKEMISYFRSQQKDKLRNIFLVHGDKEASAAFKQHLLDEKFMDVEVAKLGQVVDL